MTVDGIVSDKDLSSVLQVSSDARKQAIELVDCISDAGATGGDASEAQSEINKKIKTLNTSLSQLRGLHRDAHFGARETKAQTANARHEVDRLHLQLQNLY